MSKGRNNPTAGRELRVLILEDVVADAELCERELRRAGLRFQSRRVDARAAYEGALDEFMPDLIISDFSLPGAFDGLTALELARRKLPDVPFVFMSGTIGEERAVEAMKRGATDYVLKDRLNRLVPVIKRAIEEAAERAARRKAEEEIAHQRAFLRQVIDLDRNIIFARDREGRFTLVNQALADFYGCPVEYPLGKTYADINPDPQRAEQIRKVDLEVMNTLREVFIPEEQFTDAAGRVHWHQVVKRPLVSADGKANMVLGVATDITERKLQEQKIERLSRIRSVSSEINAAIVRLRERQALLEETCRIAAEQGKFEMVWIGMLDPEKQEVRPAAWTGFSPEAAHAVSWASIKSARGTLGEAIQTRKASVRNDIGAELTSGMLRQEALKKGCLSTVCLPFVVDDNVVALIALFATGRGFFDKDELAPLNEVAADISFALQSISRQEKLEYLSYYDALTGLPNRQLFMDRLAQQMRSRSAEPRMVALFLLDLERFRNINETLGRHGGDELLKLVAQRLEHAFHGRDYLARVSGNGFGVVMRGVRDAASIAHTIENQVLGCFREPFLLSGRELRVAAKAGIAMFPADGGDADTLFKNAEAALRNAKASGERYLFYAPQMNARVAEKLRLENQLRVALREEQFILYYQPRVELATGRISGLEALMRWVTPDRGLVPPAEFIPLLEETGMILEAGRWALKRATTDYAAWRARGLAPPRIAVNVSAIQLRQRDFVESVRTAVAAGGGYAECIDIELTESMVMEDIEGNIRKLGELRAAGMQIAIDDFGTGYSSLSYLARLPLDVLKIDRSFIVQMTNQPEHMAIVSAVISLAHSLNLKVTAEGVETEEQRSLLKLLKCDELQGYIFSRPLPLAEVEAKFSASA